MTEETLDAAILLLRSRALEVYGIIKDTYAGPAQEGDVEKLAQRTLQLANLEGGMITLQQYRESIIEAAKERQNEVEIQEDEPVGSPEPEPPAITEADLATRSESFKRSTGHHKIREVDES